MIGEVRIVCNYPRRCRCCGSARNCKQLAITDYVGKHLFASRAMMQSLVLRTAPPHAYCQLDDYESLWYTMFWYALKTMPKTSPKRRIKLPWDFLAVESIWNYKISLFVVEESFHTALTFVHKEAHGWLRLARKCLQANNLKRMRNLCKHSHG